jgi:hypothetical protein
MATLIARSVSLGEHTATSLNEIPSVMNEAVHEGQQGSLTLRLPPRAHETCTLCKSNFVIPVHDLRGAKRAATAVTVLNLTMLVTGLVPYFHLGHQWPGNVKDDVIEGG